MRIALVYGSTTGKTAAAVRLLAEALGPAWPGAEVRTFPVTEASAIDLADSALVIFATPTWGTGALQADWERRLARFPGSCTAGRAAAVLGLGDAHAFADTFCAAARTLEQRFAPAARLWLGRLDLDHDNAPDLTPGRLAAWAHDLASRFTSPS